MVHVQHINWMNEMLYMNNWDWTNLQSKFIGKQKKNEGLITLILPPINKTKTLNIYIYIYIHIKCWECKQLSHMLGVVYLYILGDEIADSFSTFLLRSSTQNKNIISCVGTTQTKRNKWDGNLFEFAPLSSFYLSILC